jgi:hypothetical protein
MELLLVLRGMWRRRLALLSGLVAAVVVLVGLGGIKPARLTAGEAWTRVAIDTNASQLVAAAPAGTGTLAWRASLIVHLMATQSLAHQIAVRLGIDSDQLTVVDPTLSQPPVGTDLATAATKAAGADVLTPYVLNVYQTDPTVPVITVDAVAADRAHAEKLAQAGTAILEAQAEPGGKLKSQIITDAGVLGRQPFVIDQVAPVQSKLVSNTSLPMKAIAAAGFVFFAWCLAVVLVVPRLRRTIRTRRSRALPA